MKKINLRPAPLPYEIPRSEIQFSGIKDYLSYPKSKKKFSFNQGNKFDTIHIVSIHGMKHKQPDQYTDVARMVAKNLEFYPIPTKDQFIPISILNGDFFGKTPYTGVRIQEFKNLHGQVMRYYMMYWSNLTKPAKIG